MSFSGIQLSFFPVNFAVFRTIATDAAANDTCTNDVTLTAANLSANSKLLSDLTPPVTPDSTPMSIGNSPNFKHQPQSFLLLNQNVITKKHVSDISLRFGRNEFVAITWVMLIEFVFFFLIAGDENKAPFHTRQSVATEFQCWWWHLLRYGWLGYAR